MHWPSTIFQLDFRTTNNSTIVHISLYFNFKQQYSTQITQSSNICCSQHRSWLFVTYVLTTLRIIIWYYKFILTASIILNIILLVLLTCAHHQWKQQHKQTSFLLRQGRRRITPLVFLFMLITPTNETLTFQNAYTITTHRNPTALTATPLVNKMNLTWTQHNEFKFQRKTSQPQIKQKNSRSI